MMTPNPPNKPLGIVGRLRTKGWPSKPGHLVLGEGLHTGYECVENIHSDSTSKYAVEEPVGFIKRQDA